ncbi:MAG: peptidoglycan DD-metalloendopeptidase family protein [Blastocatellia bacterium]|nr:peptidoglycan DD-metalloendopeptidase family protein [Blastocatellia bacterium]
MKIRLSTFPILLGAALLILGCRPEAGSSSPGNSPVAPRSERGNPFDNFLRAEAEPADGFDFPIGDPDGKGSYTDKATGKTHNGWHIATRFAEKYSMGIHTGEDWNASGGGDTDLGQDVRAVANGRVVFAENCGRLWGNVVIIEHIFYENHERRKIRSLYAHLQTIKVRSGEDVKRRRLIATVGQDPDKTFNAHLHLEMRWDETLAPTYWPSSNGKDEKWMRERYAEPSAFIAGRRKLFVPQLEQTLVLVDQESYKMRLYQKGRLTGEYDISLGQGKGQKAVQGDNKTPKGMYFVIGKSRGPFEGAYGAYYGGHWIKVNYPNRYDAARGRAAGYITPQQETAIAANWEKRAPTLENTRLGGGIGFHGWAREWSNDGPRHLSWGCVVLHLYDVSSFFNQIPPSSMVVIF